MKEYRQSWNQDEDKKLQELQKVYGEKWKKIAELLHLHQKSQGKIRTAAACRERYQNILKPTLNKNIWTREEEEKLFSLQKQYGNCWTKITVKMKNRSELICKNYFYATIRRVLRRLSKQVGILKPSQMLKSIKPSVLMSIYLEDNQETQLVFSQEIRQRLKQLITKYQFIQKEENVQFNNEETQNIRKLIRELVNSNIQYLEFKGRFQISKKNKLKTLNINDDFQKEEAEIIKRIRLQKNIFVIKQRNTQNQILIKELTPKNSSFNEDKGISKLIPIQNVKIPESYFPTQEYYSPQQNQAYYQNYLAQTKYISLYQQQYGSLFDPYLYFYNQYSPYLFQLQQRI